MTPEKMISVVNRYVETWRGRGNESERFTTDGQLPTERQVRAHLWWMCLQVPEFVRTGKFDKANRWLGFVQGAMWVLGDRTISAMREDNRDDI
jgi:hypothetical protein